MSLVPADAVRLSATALGFETYVARADNFYLGQRGTGELVALPVLEEPSDIWRIVLEDDGGAQRAHVEQYNKITKQSSNRKPVDEILNLQIFRLREALLAR